MLSLFPLKSVGGRKEKNLIFSQVKMQKIRSHKTFSFIWRIALIAEK